MLFHYRDLVGSWKLCVTVEMRQFIDREVTSKVDDPQRVREALAEAHAEAEGAEFELLADGTFISRSSGVELLRVSVPVVLEAIDELSFEKAPGATVSMRLVTSDRVEVRQPGKPVMAFERIRR
jgi:hypothetical protein